MEYLGKRVEVKVPERGNFCQLTGKFTTIVGICQSEPQRNEHLDIPLQIIIDRMPITLDNLNQIRIL